MKLKLLPLLLMVVFAFSVAQPIFALDPQINDTKIAAKDGGPLKDITISAGTPIELQARFYWYRYAVDTHEPQWIPQLCRYLDFYVYKTNADGTNGDIVWNDTAITNLFTANANPDKFTLTEKGSYNLVVKYEGKIYGKPNCCNATAKIYVV